MQDARIAASMAAEAVLGRTVGQQVAMHTNGVRTKYGTYPPRGFVLCGLWMPVPTPLPGHENDEIVPFPNTSEKVLRGRPLNRADDRERFKFYRVASFSRSLHDKALAPRGLGSRGRRIKSVHSSPNL